MNEDLAGREPLATNDVLNSAEHTLRSRDFLLFEDNENINFTYGYAEWILETFKSESLRSILAKPIPKAPLPYNLHPLLVAQSDDPAIHNRLVLSRESRLITTHAHIPHPTHDWQRMEKEGISPAHYRELLASIASNESVLANIVPPHQYSDGHSLKVSFEQYDSRPPDNNVILGLAISLDSREEMSIMTYGLPERIRLADSAAQGYLGDDASINILKTTQTASYLALLAAERSNHLSETISGDIRPVQDFMQAATPAEGVVQVIPVSPGSPIQDSLYQDLLGRGIIN